tara:strand:+ start:5648 stop:6208 length:561 start_codon:yes stop_codon:yes gene_type:complete
LDNNSLSHYLTTKEVSQVLDVSMSTLYRYISDKKLIPIKVKGRNLFNPEDVAHFNAKAEKLIDKLSKKTTFNSHRITELELRLNNLENLLKISSQNRIHPSDVNVKDLRIVLQNILSKKVWNINTIEDVLKDIARFSVELVNKLGRALIKDVLHRVILQARLCNHQRSELFVAKARVLRYELNLAS